MADKSDILSKPGSSGWHIALERATLPGHYLGDPAVVESIVRHFIAGVVTRYGHVSDGDLSGAVASTTDRAECERLGRVFAGQDKDYVAVGDWNGPGLAMAVRHEMDERLSADAELDDLAAITEGLAVIVHLVYDALRSMPVGRGEVDEATRGKLDAIVRYATGLLSGVK